VAIDRTTDLARVYDHTTVEQRIYAAWEVSGAFTPEIVTDAETEALPFAIVIPPPNVTGVLHHGSAFFVTLQDLMTRWRRMQGRRTLWLPGTDHAGIATQNVVEDALAREGLSRFDLGRDRFVERVWQWKEQYGSIITSQLRRMGASVDWTRERFTLDEGLSRAVREAFVRLYEKGLIYRGSYLVNWCPRCTTVLSDLEVDHVETDGQLWHIRYPVADGSGRGVVVATTRPETMLGDTAVAVHPDDERYTDLVGLTVTLPLVEREIPLISDSMVDRAFGTGAVKITPAHDPADYETGRRHCLPSVTVIDSDARMTADAGPYVGVDRYEARKRIVADLDARGLLVRVEAHRSNVSQCSRCDTVLEPRISEQWFVRTKPLADPAIAAVRNGRIRIIPERFERTYYHWMENIRDWVISRQLWWGHRIPVWYCAHGHMTVMRTDPTACATCGGNVRQDEDVLDTWFSSALWPFSTLGWPEETRDLKYFYPTSVMETGYDIIFFWVARMIMTGLEFMGEVPFRTVYLHGMVRHADGTKVSKSDYRPGDDPVEVIEQYGADALRFVLATASTPGNDLRLSFKRVEGARNFTNKLWNAARFVLSTGAEGEEAGQPGIFDLWIERRADEVTDEVTRHLEEFNFGEAGRLLYDFVWSEYCDWYLEIAKLSLRGADSCRATATRRALHRVLRRVVTLLHPFIPFVTEEIWRSISPDGRLLIQERWPSGAAVPAPREPLVDLVFDIIRSVRGARAEKKVEAARRIDAIIEAPESAPALREQSAVIASLASIAWLEIVDRLAAPPADSLRLVVGAATVHVPMAGLVDAAAERLRVARELEEATQQRDRVAALLANETFVARARPDVVARERERLRDAEERTARLRDALLNPSR